jgi:Zn-finger nucleic acid-binding protein
VDLMNDRLQCPRCEVNLVERTNGPAAVLACARCGGVWLDVAACRRLVQRAPETAPLLFLADRSAAAARVQPAETSGAGCPVCSAPMQRTPVVGVEATIDTCSHGTWFDARELRIVAEALRPVVQPPAQALRIPTPITPPRSYGDQFDADTVEMFGDTIEFFVWLLGSLFDDDRR